jgi:hypothetical protein
MSHAVFWVWISNFNLSQSLSFWKIYSKSKKTKVNTAHTCSCSISASAGNAFLTLLKWAITCIINLVKTSFLVTAALPLHLDMKGVPEKRKSWEVHGVGLNLFCFQKLNKWSLSSITSATLPGIASFYFLPFVGSDLQ